MGSNSGVIQAIGRLFGSGGDDRSGVGGATEADSAAALMDIDDLDPLIDNVGNFSPTDESSIIPTGAQPGRITQARRAGSRGSWTTNVSYSLQRPRDPALDSRQMLTGSIRLQPTAMWGLSWRTAYDIEKGAFNDHSIRLTRDLHRWQANFDFLQTATGNWSFRFEVSLMDNRDLKFDYDQQNLDLGLPAEERES